MAWHQRMVQVQLSWEEAQYSLLFQKLHYPLTATVLTKAQCMAIMQPVLQGVLPAMGFNCHFSWAVAYSPYSKKGLNLPNLYTKQVVSHISTLLKYGVYPKDPTVILLQANAEAMRLESGLCGHLIKFSQATTPCLTQTWLTECWGT